MLLNYHIGRFVVSGLQAEAPNPQHTANQERDDQCCNSTA